MSEGRRENVVNLRGATDNRKWNGEHIDSRTKNNFNFSHERQLYNTFFSDFLAFRLSLQTFYPPCSGGKTSLNLIGLSPFNPTRMRGIGTIFN